MKMKYTIDSIGQALDNHVSFQQKWETEISADVELLKIVLITGNGEPSLKEQVHRNNDWIGGANKLLWIVVTALVSQMVIGLVALLVIAWKVLGGGA